MTSNDTTYRMAEVTLAVFNTLSDLDLTAWSVGVSDPHSLRADVQLAVAEGVAGVDLIATHLGLGRDPQQPGGIYIREGQALVYGHEVEVRVYCSRPESMRVSVPTRVVDAAVKW